MQDCLARSRRAVFVRKVLAVRQTHLQRPSAVWLEAPEVRFEIDVEARRSQDVLRVQVYRESMVDPKLFAVLGLRDLDLPLGRWTMDVGRLFAWRAVIVHRPSSIVKIPNRSRQRRSTEV